MNTSIVAQTSSTTAFRFGAEDATSGKPCVPEMVFLQRSQQVAYALGYEAITGPTFATVQFTGSIIPAPIVVPNLKRTSGGEFVRRTDANVQRIFSANAARDRRIAQAAQETASFLNGALDGDIIFMSAAVIVVAR
jgi:hypothetical protein